MLSCIAYVRFSQAAEGTIKTLSKVLEEMRRGDVLDILEGRHDSGFDSGFGSQSLSFNKSEGNVCTVPSSIGIKRRHFWTFGFVTTILQLQITEGLSELPWKSPPVLTGDFDPHLCTNKGKNQAYIIEIGCMMSFSAVCCEEKTNEWVMSIKNAA